MFYIIDLLSIAVFAYLLTRNLMSLITESVATRHACPVPQVSKHSNLIKF